MDCTPTRTRSLVETRKSVPIWGLGIGGLSSGFAFSSYSPNGGVDPTQSAFKFENVEGEGKNVAYYLHTELTFKMLSSQKHGQTIIYTTMYRIKILSKLYSYSH